MLTRLTLLLCLLVLAAPALAVAQSPFDPLPPQAPPTQTPTATASSTADDGDGLAAWQVVLILGAGGALLLGIAWAIVSDARSKAPVETVEQSTSKVRSEAEAKRRKQQARARERRARESRKKNRPR